MKYIPPPVSPVYCHLFGPARAPDACVNFSETLSAKALAKRAQRQFFTLPFQLVFRLAAHFRWLALTLIEFKFVHKSTQVDRKSTVHAWNLWLLVRLAWTCEQTYESVWPRIASPCASSGFANLRRLASTWESDPFGQGLMWTQFLWLSSRCLWRSCGYSDLKRSSKTLEKK